jgi:hypothetical protein
VDEICLDHEQITLARLLDHPEQPFHLHHFLELLVDEPLKKALSQVIVLLDRQVHEAGDLPGDFLLPLERGLHRIFRRGKRRLRCGNRGDLQRSLGVEDVLHELQCVLALLLGLVEEELREQRQVPLLEVGGDADVLHAGPEFVADLFVEGFGELRAD